MNRHIIFILSLILVILSPKIGCSSLSPSINLSRPILKQGEFITVSLSTPKTPSRIWGRFHGKRIIFTPQSSPNSYSAFVGADVLARLGLHPLEINVDYPDGKASSTIELIFIQQGAFRKEKLRYGKTTDQEEKVKERVRQEFLMMGKILSSGSTNRYWEKPFTKPVNSIMTSPFGSQRIFNNELQTVHTGVDLRAGVGTPIEATNRGKIAYAGELYYCGKTVLIDHGGGIFSQYCHLSKINVKQGQTIEHGTVIGLAGTSGRVTAPHLHWAIHINGARISPLYFLEQTLPWKEF
ncbi:MAG TPA: M23 family metallopeptidase [Bdellovibrionota bacterium]|nr:M23 family metallopeptidase [Bdellovibrionota bacterium]